jgi:hypothetical protein
MDRTACTALSGTTATQFVQLARSAASMHLRFVEAPSIDYARQAGDRNMKSREDIESYLMKAGLPYEQLGPELWNVRPEGNENLLISIAGPVVVFRIKVMDLPAQGREKLYETLLKLNTTEMVHGAFGIEGNAVVITDALQLENLDFNEFQAVIDDITMAISKHYPVLSKFRVAA